MKKEIDIESIATFVVDPKKKLSKEEVTNAVFGISLEQLIQNIRENKDGKYDCLYQK